jgi:hypothetical protein
MTHPAESSRQYSLANGGHVATAAAIGVSVIEFIDTVAGRRRASGKFAAGIGPLIGVMPNLIIQADPDGQLLFMKNRLP